MTVASAQSTQSDAVGAARSIEDRPNPFADVTREYMSNAVPQGEGLRHAVRQVTFVASQITASACVRFEHANDNEVWLTEGGRALVQIAVDGFARVKFAAEFAPHDGGVRTVIKSTAVVGEEAFELATFADQSSFLMAQTAAAELLLREAMLHVAYADNEVPPLNEQPAGV